MSPRRRVLLDENLPTRLRLWLPSVEAISVEFLGWKGVRNGDLVRQARAEGFVVLATADRPLARTRQAWSSMGCVYLTANSRRLLQAAAGRIDLACRTVVPGQMIRVQV